MDCQVWFWITNSLHKQLCNTQSQSGTSVFLARPKLNVYNASWDPPWGPNPYQADVYQVNCHSCWGQYIILLNQS